MERPSKEEISLAIKRLRKDAEILKRIRGKDDAPPESLIKVADYLESLQEEAKDGGRN
jgi:hypothetical protein